MIIEWRPVPGFPDYEVSNTGLVRSYKRSKPYVLRTSKQSNSYRQVALRRDGKTHVHKVGRLVLLAFRGPCPEDCEMCHNDGNPINDHLDNLRWDTHAANMQEAIQHRIISRHEFYSTSDGIKCIRCHKNHRDVASKPCKPVPTPAARAGGKGARDDER